MEKTSVQWKFSGEITFKDTMKAFHEFKTSNKSI